MAKKKKKKDKKKKKEETEEQSSFFDISQETRNGIWTIASFALAILSVLSFAHEGGKAGEFFNTFARSLFGWGFFLIPVAFLFLAISFVKSFSRRIYTSALVGTLLLVFSVLGLFFIVGDEPSFGGRVVQGGYLGAVLGFPFLAFFGFKASLVGFLAIAVIAVLVALDIPIYKLFLRKKSEEEDGEAAAGGAQPLVIKQGAQVLDPAALKKEGFAAAPIENRMGTKKNVNAGQDDPHKDFNLGSSVSGRPWKLPMTDMLNNDEGSPKAGDIAQNANIIKRTFSNFGIEVEMGEVNVGPTVTQYTLRPAVGVKLSHITSLQNDLALALASHPLRLEAPIPGKSLVGIETPNRKTARVGLRDLFETEDFRKSKYFFPLALGRDVAGYPVTVGLERMPHLLIAGATGTGKSVGINALLLSLLYKHSPDVLKLILVDPKRVELSLYNNIPHLVTPVIVDSKKTISALRWAVKEMERRYEVVSEFGARDIFSYNAAQTAKKAPILPFIVIVIDELADIMAAHGRDVEGAIVRLAQMARAVGIHLIVSTQRPSVEVITGLIKANITSRIAFQVASQVDSRTVLDTAGAEKLLGNGDLLFQSAESTKPKRIQGGFVSEKEVKSVVKFIKDQEYEVDEQDTGVTESLEEDMSGGMGSDEHGTGGAFEDPLYNDAKEIVLMSQKASASYLQRRLRVGYARAARLIDMLEENGVVGPGEGAKPREILVKMDNQIEGHQNQEESIASEEEGDTI